MQEFNIRHVLKLARMQAGITQEDMADRMHIGIRKLRDIENLPGDVGIGFARRWLEFCGKNPLQSFRAVLHPELYTDGVGGSLSDIRAALRAYIDKEAGEMELRQLWFAIHGDHGSSFPAFLQKGIADLHCPLADRLTSVVLIRSSYQRAEHLGQLVCPDQALPAMSLLDDAIDSSREAIYLGQSGYSGRKGAGE